ncbi:hypothetical protein [Paraburkholderia domus]|uniref:hypothetical protein n=1 Tax=Paraburkholderia domus TaxID=2793075 RepID=UPI001913E5D6|nr:hypothetical protein [Paraburkholderia domus]MBK5066362.1 hypothetical protein [Burkholderia sp. R-70199]CAE6969649.1 hypothetical protein R70199_08097 [Paraburkholderia domus]
MSVDHESAEALDFSNSGYFGPGHQDTVMAREKALLQAFIARFKHALLFNPKIVLADHMTFSPNFQAAYRTDDEFKRLLRGDLVELAHFEKFANGGAFTLVQFRKFREYIRRGQDPRFHPLNSDCPSDPFDEELDVIQQNVFRRFPEGSRRDELFTTFADQEIEREMLQKNLGDLWTIYRTAYDRMRSDVKSQGYPLGIVHFDVERHRSPTTKNIFDYMSEVSSLPPGQRTRLVKEIGEPIIRSHRTLLLKAEMTLMSGAYAILPADLAPYRSAVFKNSNAETVDEVNANIRERKIDLSAINTHNISALTLEEILEIRKAGQDLFDLIRVSGHKPEEFDLIWKYLTGYCRHVNERLDRRRRASGPMERAGNRVRLVQGKVANHSKLRDAVVTIFFKVLSAIGHAQVTVHTGMSEAGAVLDVPLEYAENAVRSAIELKPLGGMIDDVKAHLAFQTTENNEQLMYYE